MPTLYCFFKWLPPFFLYQCRVHIAHIAVVNTEVTNCLLRLAHSKYIGLGCLSAVADCNCFSIMICNRQHRFLCRFGGQLAAFPENRFICIVLVVHLNRQTAQVKLLSAGVGQFIRLLGNFNCTHSLFRSCDCHALADGFCIVCSCCCFCKEVVGGASF